MAGVTVNVGLLGSGENVGWMWPIGEPPADRFGRHGSGVEVSLRDVAAGSLQGDLLVVVFDAFGDDGQAERVAEFDGCAGIGGIES